MRSDTDSRSRPVVDACCERFDRRCGSDRVPFATTVASSSYVSTMAASARSATALPRDVVLLPFRPADPPKTASAVLLLLVLLLMPLLLLAV
jgi:hypothetical protein